jgi:hypothetical protein
VAAGIASAASMLCAAASVASVLVAAAFVASAAAVMSNLSVVYADFSFFSHLLLFL